MKSRRKMLLSILALTLTLSPAGRGNRSLGQTGGGYDLTWSTFDGGGHMASAGGSYSLAATIGQPDAGPPSGPMAGGGYELTGGFWPVANVCYCLADMNADGQKNGADIQRFVGCVLSGGDCSCADVDQANGVNLADVSVFVVDLLAGSSCP